MCQPPFLLVTLKLYHNVTFSLFHTLTFNTFHILTFNPFFTFKVYSEFCNFVDHSLDLYRHELSLILYPVFVHLYLELVYNNHEDAAKAFINKFGPTQESFFQV